MYPMSLFIMISLSMLASDAAFVPSTNNSLSVQLYNNIIVGDYASAVAQTRNLENEENCDVIENVVTELLRDAKRNLVEYAYQLWKEGLQETVKNHFPIEFRLILGGYFIKFVNRRDGLALKLAIATNSAGDRLLYGDGEDKTSDRISWRMIPVWDNGRVYFKIVNTHRNLYQYQHRYLKLEVANNSVGDHKAFGSKKDYTFRQQWYLHPLKYENIVMFYIFNREYSQALMLDRHVDSIWDHMLWGRNGNVFNNPEDFGWYILTF